MENPGVSGTALPFLYHTPQGYQRQVGIRGTAGPSACFEREGGGATCGLRHGGAQGGDVIGARHSRDRMTWAGLFKKALISRVTSGRHRIRSLATEQAELPGRASADNSLPAAPMWDLHQPRFQKPAVRGVIDQAVLAQVVGRYPRGIELIPGELRIMLLSLFGIAVRRMTCRAASDFIPDILKT